MRSVLCRILRSYKDTPHGPSDWIRTSGLLNPIQARYQTSPHPETAIRFRRLDYITTFRGEMQAFFSIFLSFFCRSTIHIGQKNKKRMKDKASSVKVGVADNNLTRGGHILHEQEYNTGHGISAIPDEVRGEIRRQPGQPEV